MKKFFQKIFTPNKIVGFFIFNLSFILLIYVFTNHLEDTSLAYFAYLLSTYSLILFIIWFCHACKFSNHFIKNTKLYQVYQLHFHTVLKSTLFFSTILNIIYCIFNLVVGIYYQSFWFITFAVYYFLLSLMRVSLLYHIKELGENLEQEYRRLKNCGIALLLLNIVLVGIIILILHDKVYVVALYDFYLIISAFINIFKYRNSKSPVLLASKAIKVTVAMISILSLEVAMINRFGGNDLEFKTLMTGWVGLFICVINSIMAIYLIVKANKNLRV